MTDLSVLDVMARHGLGARDVSGQDLSYRDFAAKLGVPVGTVKRWAHEGMPTVRLGPRVAVREAAARRWIAERGLKIGRRDGLVYFARGTNGLIKIGFTCDTSRRMGEIDGELLTSVRGTIALERAIQRAFLDDVDHDEWFRPSSGLLAFIDLLSEDKAA